MRQYLIGVDIGGTTIKFGVFDGALSLLEKWRIPTRTEDGGRFVLPDVAREIDEKLRQLDIAPKQVLGVGVGVPGPVTEMRYTCGAVNLNWRFTDAGGILAGLLKGMPVYIGNDANLAALAEAVQGAGRGYRCINMITLGTGLGGGIVRDGKIWEGRHGFGGEYGQALVSGLGMEDDGAEMRFEDYISAHGLERIVKKLRREGVESTLPPDAPLSAQMIFEAAGRRDAAAMEAVAVLARNLGRLLSIVSYTLDPDVFILGGGIARAGEELIDAVRRSYCFARRAPEQQPAFLLAELGNDAGIYGAAQLARNP